MKKFAIVIIMVIALAALVCIIAWGTFQSKVTMPSAREQWRITNISVDHPIVVNNLVLFDGEEKDRSVDCDCVYAINRTTGKLIWSTEELAMPYIKKVEQEGLVDKNAPSVNVHIDAISPIGDSVYVSIYYWTPDDTEAYIFFALNSANGIVLWKVDGQSDSETVENSISDMNRIFLIDNQGNLLAIDSSTGRALWQQKVYTKYDPDNTEFSYHNHMVFISTPILNLGQPSILCPPFDNMPQVGPYRHYEQITAIGADTGARLWETCTFVSGWPSYSEHSLLVNAQPWVMAATNLEDTGVLTAFDLDTGQLNWDLTLPRADELGVMTNDQHETFLLFRNPTKAVPTISIN